MRRLSRAAYLEFKVTRQISTGSFEAFLAAPEHPPGWFIHSELGYGWGEYPSLSYTLTNLTSINRNNTKMLNEREGLTIRQAKKRMSAKAYQQRLRKMARRGGVRVVAGEYIKAA